jgi:hypothetical protein
MQSDGGFFDLPFGIGSKAITDRADGSRDRPSLVTCIGHVDALFRSCHLGPGPRM